MPVVHAGVIYVLQYRISDCDIMNDFTIYLIKRKRSVGYVLAYYFSS